MTAISGIPLKFSAFLKEMLLALCLGLTVPDIGARIAGIDGLTGLATYVLLLTLLWTALAAAAFVPIHWLRWIIGLVCSVAAYYFGVYERITTQFLTYDAFINLQNSAAFAGDAIAWDSAGRYLDHDRAIFLVAKLWRARH